jgi:hypothetical protein
MTAISSGCLSPFEKRLPLAGKLPVVLKKTFDHGRPPILKNLEAFSYLSGRRGSSGQNRLSFFIPIHDWLPLAGLSFDSLVSLFSAGYN